MPASLQAARSHHAEQSRIAAAAVRAIRSLFQRRRPLAEVFATVSAYQLASATTGSRAIAAAAGTPPATVPNIFAGVSSYGFPISEPIIATIDQFVPAPVEPLPDAWWGDALDFLSEVEALIESEIRDAGRSAAQVEMVNAPDWQNYVRVLVPPSCKRCTVLAGRIYRDLEGFKRHPNCDCVHWPVQDWEEAHDAGLVSSPQEAFDKGQIRDLTEAETKAINDGADIVKVINSSRGIQTVSVFGRRVKVTTEGTTKRAAWRRANPTRLIRLRPEAIYNIAEDHEDAIRLLRLYGYLVN